MYTNYMSPVTEDSDLQTRELIKVIRNEAMLAYDQW